MNDHCVMILYYSWEIWFFTPYLEFFFLSSRKECTYTYLFICFKKSLSIFFLWIIWISYFIIWKKKKPLLYFILGSKTLNHFLHVELVLTGKEIFFSLFWFTIICMLFQLRGILIITYIYYYVRRKIFPFYALCLSKF